MTVAPCHNDGSPPPVLSGWGIINRALLKTLKNQFYGVRSYTEKVIVEYAPPVFFFSKD